MMRWIILLVTFVALGGWGQRSKQSWSFFVGAEDLIALCHPSCDCLDTYFDCRRRGLGVFPQDFPHWVHKLNMSWNNINRMEGHELRSLLQLTTLSLDGNNLSRIPKAPVQLTQLTYLSLSRNHIEEVNADSLASFSSLQELDLSRNRINALTNQSFPDNSTLLNINLGGNQIDSIESGALQPLGKIQELNLGRNRVRFLPKELFSQTRNLDKLDLSRNRLEVLDSLRFQELKGLSLLNLKRNGMTNLSDAAFYGLDRLQHLHLDGNGISLVERRWLYGLKSLKFLNLSSNVISKLQDNCWEYMEELTTLDLSWNRLEALGKKSLQGLVRLRTMDLSHNVIATFTDEPFSSLHNLHSLDISHNHLSWILEDVSGPFTGLPNLVTLDISVNRISTLHPDALSGLYALKNLNLSANPLKFLSPETFIQFPSLQIYLEEVKDFVCNCGATWLHSRLNSLLTNGGSVGSNTGGKRNRHKDVKDKKKNSPLCQFPNSLKGKFLTDLSMQDLVCSTDGDPWRGKFIAEPKTQTVLMEGNGSLWCSVEAPAEVGITLEWRRDHQHLPPHLLAQVENTERLLTKTILQANSTLRLSNVTWSDGGQYQCVASNPLGIVYSVKANVTVHVFPSFVKRPSNVTVRLGSNAKLECGAKGFPTPEMAFQKDGGENFPAALERRFHVMPSDDSFIIMDAKLTDMGSYCCSASNVAGEIRACASVTVYETPGFANGGMENVRVSEGSTTALECIVSGWPRPQIAWSKDHVLVRDDNRIRIRDNGSLLLIRDVKMTDAGKYECILSNAVGTARDFTTLQVVPGGSAYDNMHWSSPVMIVSLVIVAALCVVATVAAWFVVICRDDRKRGGSPSGLIIEQVDLSPAPRITRGSYELTCVESGSQSSQGKDSGTGDDLPPEYEFGSISNPIELVHNEHEALMRSSWRNKPEPESFLTFGGGGAGGTMMSEGRSRLSQPRLEILGTNVISVKHPPGREFLTMPRKVPMPVPPPLVPTSNSNTPTPNPLLEVSSGCSSTSSGYSTLATRHSVNRTTDGDFGGTSSECDDSVIVLSEVTSSTEVLGPQVSEPTTMTTMNTITVPAESFSTAV